MWELADTSTWTSTYGPERAGHATLTLFVGDFDPRISQIAWSRRRETYANGVRKAIFRDPDGNQIGFGGAPA